MFLSRMVMLVLIVGLAGCESAMRETGTSRVIEFAVIGDNPYVEFNMPKYETMIHEINGEDLAWVVHVGDVKGSGESCSDEFFAARFELNQRFTLPFILTPGDNDWFDCHRKAAGSYDRMDRLAAFRRIWFPNAGMTTGENAFPVVSQASLGASSGEHRDLVENVYWTHDEVVFATVHLVGLSAGEGGEDIHANLMAGGLAWIEHVFEVADKMNAKGVFLATQVDPWIATVFPPLLKMICEQCPYVRPGYEAFNDALIRHSRAFDGQVVLAVGDTHIFRVDKPLYAADGLIENFTRVETFGNPNVHWVRVVVDPSTNEVFQFHQELIEANYGVGWPEGHQ